MGHERRNRDYSKGPVWDETTSRWRVEVRYPDGSRVRKRFRRERSALLAWAAEQTKVENGTWNERAARNVTVAAAFERYRMFSEVQHRSYRSYIAPSLTLWEAHLRPSTPLATHLQARRPDTDYLLRSRALHASKNCGTALVVWRREVSLTERAAGSGLEILFESACCAFRRELQ